MYNFLCIGYLICLSVSLLCLKTPFNILNKLLNYLVRILDHIFLRNRFLNLYISRKIIFLSIIAFIDLQSQNINAFEGRDCKTTGIIFKNSLFSVIRNNGIFFNF